MGDSDWREKYTMDGFVDEIIAYTATETPFIPATLSSAELFRMTALCGFIQANGSGYGVCRSCRNGGLGASKK